MRFVTPGWRCGPARLHALSHKRQLSLKSQPWRLQVSEFQWNRVTNQMNASYSSIGVLRDSMHCTVNGMGSGVVT